MDNTKIGLVTVLYKCDDVLYDFFESIAKQTFANIYLILIDNAYNNITTGLINELIFKFKIKNYIHLDAGGNIGVAAGNNFGIKEALKNNCNYVCLLNNDIKIEATNTFQNLLHDLKNENAQLVVPKIMYYNTNLIWMAGGHMDNIRALGVHKGANKEDINQYAKISIITYAPTCFMIIAKNVFEKIGIMDEKYFAYCDDTDFVYRALKIGFKMIYSPNAVIEHKVSSSSGGDNSPFYVYYGNRNKIYFIRKHYKFPRKQIAIVYTLMARTIFYLRFNKLLKQKLLKGLYDGFKM